MVGAASLRVGPEGRPVRPRGRNPRTARHPGPPAGGPRGGAQKISNKNGFFVVQKPKSGMMYDAQ